MEEAEQEGESTQQQDKQSIPYSNEVGLED